MNAKIDWKKILVLTVFGCLAGCNYLDKDPVDLIKTEDVWKDPKLINAVLVNLYDKMEMEDFNYNEWPLKYLSTMSDEAEGGYQVSPVFDNANATYTYEDELFGAFSSTYQGIRNCNDFLLQLSESALSEAEKNTLSAEVRFVRAWHYFTLAKRYGGVPLITESQEYKGPDNLADLQLPRNKEEEVYDFILTECQEIAPVLPKQNESAAKYRADRGTAWALCSRAALYAGSIAKYGTVQLDGVVGISADKANHFFQTAYDASNEVLKLGVYSLYKQNPDKAANFTELFVTRDNGEYIFQKAFDAEAGKGHDFDKMNAPYSMTQGGWGCATCPTLELVEAFEYINGTKGTLVLTNPDGSPKHFRNLTDVFEGKDPRLSGCIFVSGASTKGSQVMWQRGIIASNGDKIVATKQPNSSEIYTDPNTGISYNVSGKDGGADVGDPSKTGFYQKKFWDETLANVAMGKSNTSWPVFRLGEIYLNLAEAAVELGGKDDAALSAVNEIRKRAGIAELPSVDLEKVRHERRIELAFEGHRFWDLRRWRIAHLDFSQGGLNKFRGTALYPWYDTRSKDYIFERGQTPKQVRLFLEKNYYIKIAQDDMNSNPKLVPNPGYTN